MKSYNTLYYLLVVLLIMGAFASMAQNSYGLKIQGGVAIAFGLLFLFQFLDKLRKKDHKDKSTLFELLSLVLLSFIFALRIFHIYFPYVEWIFGAAGIVLALVYLKKMGQCFLLFKHKHTLLAIIILSYYLSIILFIISLIAAPFVPWFSESAGRFAFIVLVGFVIAGFLSRNFLIEGENVSVYKVITRFRDRSVLLLSLFFIISLYMGFTRIGVLPELYSDEFPQAYFQLINKAETRKEVPVNGRYKHEEFKKMYDQFLNRNIKKDPNSGTAP